MSNTVGGLNKQAILVTEDRPLSLSDPTLESILLNQRYAILQRYSRTKRTASTKDAIELRPVSFTTQVVAGTNYFVKLEVVPCGTTQLTGLLVDKTFNDEFSYDSFGDQGFEDVTLEESGIKRADHHQQLEDATAHTMPHISIRK
ncbi:hypothetical protein BGZ74_005449 [Mortierella antarctica]|nr:hypothetical protein BGZ74_005449 [Mortierella antarctica]